MNAAVFEATLRERLSGIINLALIALMLALPSVTTRDGLSDANSPFGQLALTLIVAAGAISRELSAGTLSLVFCRPIVRSDYVLTKWITLSCLALSWGLVQLGSQWVACALSGVHVSLPAVAQNVFERATISFGVVSAVLFFSTIATGSLDVVLWLIAYITVALAGSSDYEWPKPVAKQLTALLSLHIRYVHTFHSHPIEWSALFAYASGVCIWLALACWVLGRKEVSYAT